MHPLALAMPDVPASTTAHATAITTFDFITAPLKMRCAEPPLTPTAPNMLTITLPDSGCIHRTTGKPPRGPGRRAPAVACRGRPPDSNGGVNKSRHKVQMRGHVERRGMAATGHFHDPCEAAQPRAALQHRGGRLAQ